MSENISTELVQQLILQNRQLMQQVEVLQQQLAIGTQERQTEVTEQSSRVAAEIRTEREPKILIPDAFHGDRTKSRAFILQLKVVFRAQPSRFMTENSKVLFTVTFGDINRPRQAEFEILELKQGKRSASVYISDFQRLSTELGWSGAALLGIFYKGLNNEIKSSLCNHDRPNTIEEFYDLVARIDNRHREYKQEIRTERTGQNFQSSFIANNIRMADDKIDDMVIGTTRGPLFIAERERRFRENLCLYCGEPGHVKLYCKKRKNRSKNRYHRNDTHDIIRATRGNNDNSIICLFCGSNLHDLTSYSTSLNTFQNNSKGVRIPDQIIELIAMTPESQLK